MNVRITDKKVFEGLKPLDVVTYLRTTGWILTGVYRDSASIWKHNGHQVMVPQETAFADYARRLADVMEVLAETESRSPLEILRDLTTSTADVVRVRLTSPSIVDGSVSLEAGVSLIESSRDLVLSAARAAVCPRAYYRSRLPWEADEYIRRVRLGQTEIGSYVVTVVCPVSPELHAADSLASVEEPFDRRVTRTLAGALHKTTGAAREAALNSDMKPFTTAVADGVSANLCSALVEMGESLDDGQVEIDFSWSRSRQKPAVATSRVIVPSDAIPLMREAARVLRETYSDDDFELIGPVIRLESTSVAHGGSVIVYAPVGDTWRKVLVHLQHTDYDLAVNAHGQGETIRCKGKLQKEGRYFTMRHVSEFGIQNDTV